ncbi:MAG: hypothetical protein Q9157_001655 [Trypethelium eluteriae]
MLRFTASAMAWEFLAKIGVTPAAILFVQTNPQVVPETLVVIVVLFVLLPGFAYYVHYVTSKNQGTYKPPFSEGIPFITKGKGKNAKGGRK